VGFEKQVIDEVMFCDVIYVKLRN